MEYRLLSLYAGLLSLIVLCSACGNSSEKSADGSGNAPVEFTGAENEVKLITLDPGHFHAGLVQKYMYDRVDPMVHVYAPEGKDLQWHLDRIEQFNNRKEDPTNWQEKIYRGQDFLQKMIEDKSGNVVVIAGNNARKTQYIKESVEAGLNVLGDKPMVIKPEKYPLLEEAFEIARKKGVLLYDIMTERYEITTLLQEQLSTYPDVFGELVKGSPEDPAIIQQSVHHFFKYVAGQPLTRPAWFFDVDQEGEGIVDVSTHLVDMVMMQTFPKQAIDTSEVEVMSARHWTTDMAPSQFERVTGTRGYPDYLQDEVKQDSILKVYSNGEFTFRIHNINAKVSVAWHYEAPEGSGDTHYAMMRGTKANLVIRQGKEQNYEPSLYIEPVEKSTLNEMESKVKAAISNIDEKYPGVSVKTAKNGWEVVIPGKYRVGHEAHFAQVTQKYLKYLTDGKLPDWERQNMLTKYYLTTRAYELSR